MSRTTITIGMVAIALRLAPVPVAGQTSLDAAFTYQGNLTDGGAPADGWYDMVFNLYADADGTSHLDRYPAAGVLPVDVQDGLFTVLIQFDGAHFKGDKRWLEIVVEDTALWPLVELTARPYALYALDTQSIAGHSVDELAPSDGQVLKWNDAQATWAPGDDAGQAYTAGDGLTLMGDAFTLDTGYTDALYVNEGQVGCISEAMLESEAVTTAKIQDGAVTDAKITDVAWDKITGAPSSLPPTGAASGDLSGTYPDPTVAQLQGRSVSSAAPDADQALKWNGSAWAPAADSDTTYTAGQGLTLSGTTFNVGAGDGIDTTSTQVKVDVSDFAGSGLVVEGTNDLMLNLGTGLEFYGLYGDTVGLRSEYSSGSAYDSRFVNEGQTDSITAAMLQSNSVGSSEIASNAVGSSEIASDAVGSSEIVANAVGSAEITAGAVGSSEIDNGAVIEAKIAPSAVTGAKIASGAVTTSKLSASGGSDGKALVYGGGGVVWGYPTAEELDLPYAATVSSYYSLLDLTNTSTNNDQPAILGTHDATDYYGVGVRGVGGWKGVEAECTPTGDDAYHGIYSRCQGGSGNNAGVDAKAKGAGTNYGVFTVGESTSSGSAYGVYGWATGTGTGNKYAIFGTTSGSGTKYAGYFSGNAHVTGTLSKGSGSFKIDHPLDPENKYLYHSFVESPDMMNVYNGNVVLDGNGEALIELPDWFEALNRDFRYQLTCIGGFAPVYVAQKIRDNQFTIAGGNPGLEVSWQVTGIRHDPFAEAHRIPVEEYKETNERGKFLHPAAYGRAEDYAIDPPPLRNDAGKTDE